MIILLLLSAVLAEAQTGILSERSFHVTAGSSLSRMPLSNSITDIVISGDTIWLGTGRGLSRSTDRGRSWKNYNGTPEFGNEDVSALAVRGKDVWVATAHTVTVSDQSMPEGSGLRYSSDGGETWRVIPQPVDANNVDTLFWNAQSTIRALGITTAINNITYDIAIAGTSVYICSFAGMARVSHDTGRTWHRVILPPDNLNSISRKDSLKFDLSPSGGALGLQNNLNHRAFSVMAENDSTIWIGTAGGVNELRSRGDSVVRHTKQNNIDPISGNFVVAIHKQSTPGGDVIWAATVNATDNTERRGVSYTTNRGATWKQTLLGEFAHNFGFKGDTVVYVPTDNGLFRSTDQGQSWMQSGTIYDRSNRQRYTQSVFYAAAAAGDSIWFGGADGLLMTVDSVSEDFGLNWTILHASQPPSTAAASYAYPNPFAPDDEVVRVHYSTGKSSTANVSLRIFDFGMNLVRTVVQNAPREANREHDEIWDGRNQTNTIVANGVYFYQLTIDSDEPRWGKILVIQ
ncbi:MAG: hypothetical protein HUU02_09175 [Bacteroidetes bacterium]|nr:hypothetical protein [Bacteroidota bacterium]